MSSLRRSNKYTKEMIEFVRDHVKEFTDKEIANLMEEKFNIPMNAGKVANIKFNNRIKSGIKRGTFQKGNVPRNKGLKQTDYMTKEQIKRTMGTRFKKGQVSHNKRPIDSTRVCKGGYIEIKTKEPHTWERLHRVIWMKHHGTIPKGYDIVFLDQNPINVNIENLVLVNKRIKARMSKQGYYSSDPKITKMGLNVSKLMLKTKQKEKEVYESTQ